jgi:hypothetical protein
LAWTTHALASWLCVAGFRRVCLCRTPRKEVAILPFYAWWRLWFFYPYNQATIVQPCSHRIYACFWPIICASAALVRGIAANIRTVHSYLSFDPPFSFGRECRCLGSAQNKTEQLCSETAQPSVVAIANCVLTRPPDTGCRESSAETSWPELAQQLDSSRIFLRSRRSLWSVGHPRSD